MSALPPVGGIPVEIRPDLDRPWRLAFRPNGPSVILVRSEKDLEQIRAAFELVRAVPR